MKQGNKKVLNLTMSRFHYRMLLDYEYIENHNRLITVDLIK